MPSSAWAPTPVHTATTTSQRSAPVVVVHLVADQLAARGKQLLHKQMSGGCVSSLSNRLHLGGSASKQAVHPPGRQPAALAPLACHASSARQPLHRNCPSSLTLMSASVTS